MPRLETFDVAALRTTITTFSDVIGRHAERINRLNVYPVPDGDTGTNMARTLQHVVAELDGAADDAVSVCDAISHGSLMGARGNSGVILSQVMRGLVGRLRESLTDGTGVTAASLAEALTAASTASYQAVLKPVEGTILTVVRETADAASDAAAQGAGFVEVVRAAREAGGTALERTPELLAVLANAGVVDAGGAGYLLFLDALLYVVDDEPLPEVDASFQAPAGGGSEFHPSAHDHPPAPGDGRLDADPDIGDLRYEVMYFVEIADERIEAFKTSWGQIGDSIVVVGGDGIWNCHVHTNDIGAAIESALDLDGRPSGIRVTDLFEEVADEHTRREAEVLGNTASAAGITTAAAVDTRSTAGLPPVDCAVVAVANGDGLVELFGQLGVQGVVTGGQTANPSTAELLDVVEHVNADEVVVLPNNKNIIAVAEQVDALTTKHVVVVPTTSMPEALAALIVYDPETDASGNAESMHAAAGGVATGEVTQAVRSTATDIGDIGEGDWIAIVSGDGIVGKGETMQDAAIALLDHLLDGEHELVTIITGIDATPAAAAAVEGWLRDGRADVDVEVHRGGQPLYPFLVGIE